MATLNPTVQAGIAGFESGFNNSLRLQQLRSQRAMQRLEERRMVQQMDIAAKQYDLAVQERADMEKAMARVQMQSQEMLPTMADGPAALGGQPPGAFLPNPNYVPLDQALLQNVLPVVAKYRPAQAGNFLADISRFRQEQFQPRVGELTTKGGRQIEFFQGGPNSAIPIGGGGIVETTTTPQGDQFYFDVRGNPHRIPRDSEGRQLRVDDIKKLKDAPGGAKLLEWDDNKGAFVLPARNAEAAQQVLAKAHSITTGTRAKIEQQQLEVAKVFRAGHELASLLTPENVGARGNLTRLWEGIAGQIDPDYKVGDASTAESTAASFRAGVMRGMRSDSNIAEPERAQLLNAMPQVDLWLKGPQDAKLKLASILQQWGNLSRDNAQTLGNDIFPQWLTLDEVADQLASGAITAQQADDLMSSNGWRLIEALRRDVQKQPSMDTSGPRNLKPQR